MSFAQVVFLAIIQGLTEFLPISSSGHLVLFQYILKLSVVPVFFDILLHVGTLIAVLIFFRPKITWLTRETLKAVFHLQFNRVPRMVIWIILGSLPAATAGIYLNSLLGFVFSSLSLLTLSFLFTSLLLISTSWIKSRNNNDTPLTWPKSIGIGLFQAIALFPGVSRSGATIVAGEWLGLSPEKAFEFSFLLSIPATLGALFLQLPQMSAFTAREFPLYLLGVLLSAVSGWFSLKFLRNIVLFNKLYLLGLYTFFLSLLTMTLLIRWV